MSDPADANAEFEALWDEIGKKRLIIGDEDKKAVEIRLDVDLSPVALLKRLNDMSADGVHDHLRRQLDSLLHKRRD
ncbi:MAG: hypothetical protein ACFB6S_16405 [Geminicoccaceae bacterium]